MLRASGWLESCASTLHKSRRHHHNRSWRAAVLFLLRGSSTPFKMTKIDLKGDVSSMCNAGTLQKGKLRPKVSITWWGITCRLDKSHNSANSFCQKAVDSRAGLVAYYNSFPFPNILQHRGQNKAWKHGVFLGSFQFFQVLMFLILGYTISCKQWINMTTMLLLLKRCRNRCKNYRIKVKWIKTNRLLIWKGQN